MCMYTHIYTQFYYFHPIFEKIKFRLKKMILPFLIVTLNLHLDLRYPQSHSTLHLHLHFL